MQKKTIAFLLSTLILLCCDKEEAAFKSVINMNTIDAYMNFLTDYPESKFSSIIKDSLIALEFKKVQICGTFEAYKQFIDKYPNYSQSVIAKKFITVEDIDGNIYNIVKVGSQPWMNENLKVTHYGNGDKIPQVTKNLDWFLLKTGAYCNYNNDEEYADIYGRLYNWYAVHDKRNLAPVGWHVATYSEWKALIEYLDDSVAADKMKEAGTAHWEGYNTKSTNESGLTVLPSGYRGYLGRFEDVGYIAIFWPFMEHVSRTAKTMELEINQSFVYDSNSYMQYGYSVRCIKD